VPGLDRADRDGLSEFLATRVFGSYRENLLDASLRELDDDARQDHQRQVTAARRAIPTTSPGPGG
jgi:hypothetical protein